MRSELKGIPVAPLTGTLDLRTPPDLLQSGSLRMRQNLQTVGEGKLRRGCGWEKLLSSDGYNNADFHDQLLTFTPNVPRQPVTCIFEAVSARRVRTVFAATQSKIATLDEYAGNYKVLGSGFGGTPSISAAAPRFQACQCLNHVVFTNDLDKPMYHVLEESIIGTNLAPAGPAYVPQGSSQNSIYPGDGVYTEGLVEGELYVYTPGSNDQGIRLAGTNQTLASGEFKYDGSGVVFIGPTGTTPQSITANLVVSARSHLHHFGDLDKIGLTRAAMTWSRNNVLFLADVMMDGDRFANRIVWSDYANPTSFDPAIISSIAGYKDLYSHERILKVQPFGNCDLIYTTHGIWRMDVVGGDQSFSFTRIFNGEAKGNEDVLSGILKYPNTLVGLPDQHIYAGEDGIYAFNPYYGRPERVEWLYKSCGYLFDDIDSVNCSVHVAGYSTNEVYFSFASVSALNHCPDKTLRINTQYKTSDIVDYGFVAYGNHKSQSVPTVRDFIIENGICSLSAMIANSYGYDQEGLPSPLPSSSAAFTPTCFKTHQTADFFGVTIEDVNTETPAGDSLCALLSGVRLDELCRRCVGPDILVAASSSDWCLKQIGNVFYREECTNPDAVGSTVTEGYQSSVGAYRKDGYDSLIRFAPLQSGDQLVQVDEVRINYIAAPQNPPSTIGLRVGISGTPADPNEDGCIVWFQHSLQDLKCITGKTMAQHLEQNTIPAELAKWNIYRKGRVLYAEMKITGTGGDCVLSMAIVKAKPVETVRY